MAVIVFPLFPRISTTGKFWLRFNATSTKAMPVPPRQKAQAAAATSDGGAALAFWDLWNQSQADSVNACFGSLSCGAEWFILGGTRKAKKWESTNCLVRSSSFNKVTTEAYWRLVCLHTSPQRLTAHCSTLDHSRSEGSDHSTHLTCVDCWLREFNVCGVRALRLELESWTTSPL